MPATTVISAVRAFDDHGWTPFSSGMRRRCLTGRARGAGTGPAPLASAVSCYDPEVGQLWSMFARA